MIGIIFRRLDQVVKVIIDGNNLYFQDNPNDNRMYPFESLRLEYSGVVKEFPELKESPNWHEKAIELFKSKVKNMQSEEEIFIYVKTELTKVGYIPLIKQRAGFRPEKI